MHGNFAANRAVQNADVILNIGSRFDDRIIGNPNLFAPHANDAYQTGNGGIIHVNLEASEFNQNVKSHVCVHSSSRDFLREILHEITYRTREKWMTRIKEWKMKHPFEFTVPKDDALNTQMVISEISDQLLQQVEQQKQQQQLHQQISTTTKSLQSENDKNKHGPNHQQQQQQHQQTATSNAPTPYFITTGVGNHQMMTSQFIKWTHPNTLLTSGSMGVMGVSLPYAIGAQIANPCHRVISIDGDGSFNQTMSELKTVADHNLPIKIAIINDGAMSMVKAWEHMYLEQRHSGSHIKPNLSYSQLAHSFRMKSMICRSKEELPDTVAEFLAYDGGPVLCDFRVKPDFCFPFVKPGHALDDMIHVGEFRPSDLDGCAIPS